MIIRDVVWVYRRRVEVILPGGNFPRGFFKILNGGGGGGGGKNQNSILECYTRIFQDGLVFLG